VSFYLDTSVIVAIVLNEAAAEPVRGWFSRSTRRMIIADLSALEFSAVISRAVRTQRFDESRAALALTNFDMLRSACEPLPHGPADFAISQAPGRSSKNRRRLRRWAPSFADRNMTR
jgi:predicted nucleic acid-binding protein